MATKCGRCRILSHCVQRSTMLPSAAATTIQFSHFASTPSLPFQPSRDDIVGAENVLAAFGSGNRGESRPVFLALRLCQDSAIGITHHDNKRDSENNEK